MNKISPFTHIYHKGNYTLLFNPLTLEKYYLHQKDYEKILENKDAIKKYLIVEENFNEKEYFDRIKQKILKNTETLGIIICYLLLTSDCNYDCKYCFIKTNLKEKTYMAPETAKKAINFFQKNRDETAKPTIYFYGGEPLLNFQTFKTAVEEIKTKIPEALIVLVTNGSLLTKEITNFLAKNQIHISLSIDGPKELNNKARLTKEKDDPFNLTLQGLNNLKESGINPAVLCTVGTHNIDHLEDAVQYFINKLKLKNINLILQKRTKSSISPDPKKVARQMIRCYEIAKINDLKLNKLTRSKITPFVTNTPWVKECAGYGHQIIITPEGKVGPCHALWPLNEQFDLTLDTDINIVEFKTWKEWKKRVTYNEPRCQYCEAISLCGGGCAFNYYNQKEGIWNLDKTTCEFTKEVLNWMVWAYFEHKHRQEITFENRKLIIKLPSWTDDKRYNIFLKKTKDQNLIKNYTNVNKVIMSIYEDKGRFLLILDKTELIGIAYGKPQKYTFLEGYENQELITQVSKKLKELNQTYLTGETKKD